MTKHNHYFKDVAHLQQVDVYRILELFEVTCPVAQHIVKKALAAGKRGAKSPARDMQDIADSANRWLAMREEDAGADITKMGPEPIKGGPDEWKLPAGIVASPAMVKLDEIQPGAISRPSHEFVGFIHPFDAAYNLTKGAA